MTYAAVEEEFAAWFRAQRHAASVTQQEVADGVGCSLRAIQTYEAGTSFPRPVRRRKIAAYFAARAEEAAA